MLKFIRNRSFKKYIMISFAIIFTIPMLCNIFIISKCKEMMKENIYEYSSAEMAQISDIMDGYLNTVDLIGSQIADDVEIKDLLENQPQAESYIQISNILYNYKNKCPIINDICFYDKKEDIIITSKQWTDSKNYFENYCRFDGYEYDTWREAFLDTYRYKSYMNSLYYNGINEIAPMTIYVQTLPISPTEESTSQLMITIAGNSLIDAVSKKLSAYEAQTYMIDNKGKVLFSSTNEKELDKRIFSKIPNNVSGRFYVDINGVKNVVLYSNSPQLKWTYLICMPDSVFLSFLNRLNVIVIGAYLICLIFGLYAIYYFERRGYAPIKKIISRFGGQYENASGTGNEFDYINSRISEISQMVSSLEETVQNKNSALRDEYLLKLLKGMEVDKTKLKELNLDLSGSDTVIFRMGILFSEDVANREKESDMIRYILNNIICEILMEQTIFNVKIDNETILFFVSSDSMLCRNADELSEVAEILVSLMQEQFDIDLNILISKAHSGASALKECYDEIIQMNQNPKYSKSAGVYNYAGIEINQYDSGEVYYYPFETENRLINLCMAGDSDAAGQLLDEIFDKNRALTAKDFTIAKCLCFNLFGTYIKIISNISDKPESVDRKVVMMFERKTLEEQEKYLKTLFCQLCDKFKALKKDDEQMLRNIKDYINKNYMRYDLSLSSIGDEFGISSKYLSSYFKKHENVNLSDYISQIRMEKAKELLLETQLPIDVIAKNIGYSSVIVFSRFFKKREGIPPGKFRSINEKR